MKTFVWLGDVAIPTTAGSLAEFWWFDANEEPIEITAIVLQPWGGSDVSAVRWQAYIQQIGSEPAGDQTNLAQALDQDDTPPDVTSAVLRTDITAGGEAEARYMAWFDGKVGGPSYLGFQQDHERNVLVHYGGRAGGQWKLPPGSGFRLYSTYASGTGVALKMTVIGVVGGTNAMDPALISSIDATTTALESLGDSAEGIKDNIADLLLNERRTTIVDRWGNTFIHEELGP